MKHTEELESMDDASFVVNKGLPRYRKEDMGKLFKFILGMEFFLHDWMSLKNQSKSMLY